ncbi:sensor domain-containing diguanylate cyclase [Aquibacillus kalidii]|uniref:sensor domain-containing diguanylate cyclase n=1 Tax=Aquibacillus kalidii TaxID=2762597 RepID=UPI0016451DB0|nr:sensor domain-containing diguanylate cyclase [Aquibacillus kalidii]
MKLSDQLLHLMDNEPQLRLLIDMVEEFIVLKDGQGRWLVTNKQVLKAYDLLNVEYQGKTDIDLIQYSPHLKDSLEYNVETDNLAWEHGSAIKVEKTLISENGMQTYEVSKTPVFDELGERQYMVIVSRNITDRKYAEEKLRASEMRYRLIAENMKDLVLMLDHNGTITFLSPSFEQELGHPYTQFIGKSPLQFVHPDDHADLIAIFKEMIQNKYSKDKLELRCLNRNKQYAWFEANWSCVYNLDGSIDTIVISAREVTERKKYEDRLQSMAYYDYLTNIPNRRYFMLEFPKAIKLADKDGTMLGLIYLDLDYFKEINDEKGHDIGDALLMKFVQRIQNNLRETDTVARIGGDEFVILLSDLKTRSEVEEIVYRLSESLAHPWKLKDCLLETTSSIGVAIYPDDGSSVHELISRADKALYSAKYSGRNQIKFYNQQT